LSASSKSHEQAFREVAKQLTAGKRRWYDRLAGASAEIDCGGAQHRITWRRGKLVLEDHDVLSERSLVALGSKPPRCLEILDAWREMRGSELVHELLMRQSTLSPEELALRRASLDANEENLRRMPQMAARLKNHPRGPRMLSQMERHAKESFERERRMWSISLIEGLPSSLRRALALSVIVSIERHWHDESYRRSHARHIESALAAIVLPLFEESARHWRHNLKPYAGFVAETWLLSPGEQPTCAAWADGGGAYAALSLPLSWFIDVWARGIALVEGCLVLGVDHTERQHSGLRVTALRWERQVGETSKSVEAPAHITLTASGSWRLRWR
jgi:hypothetical protein